MEQGITQDLINAGIAQKRIVLDFVIENERADHARNGTYWVATYADFAKNWNIFLLKLISWFANLMRWAIFSLVKNTIL